MMWGYGIGNSWPLMGIGYGLGIIWFFFISLIWLLPVIFLIYFILWIFRGRRNKACRSFPYGGLNDEETPLEILKKRYARGEITKEEFEEMKRTIGFRP